MRPSSPLVLAPCPVVLVIEDEPGDAQWIRRQLLEPGHGPFAVHLAASLAIARRMIDQEGLCPDVVLLDLNLPDSTGIDTVERCRALTEAPLVVLTGLNDALATQAAIQSGAEDYLTKGGDSAALRRAIRFAMLRHRRDNDVRLAAAVFAHAREGIMITDAAGAIVDVNDAFARITGYAREEVLGANPRLLSSGRHPAEFYVALWQGLVGHGHWDGEIWNRRKNGEVYAEMLTISAVRDSRGTTRQYVALFSDITALKAQETRLEHLAHYDALTGLPNRLLLADRLQQAMSQAQRRGQRLALVFIDLDEFKIINDTYGHETGDLVLVTVAARMKQVLREGDTLARLGGDEFVAVLLDMADIEVSAPTLNRLLDATARPIKVGDLSLQLSGSLGVTFYPQAKDVDTHQLLHQADLAMYQAKLGGKNRYHLWNG